jgi:hypothetical protein
MYARKVAILACLALLALAAYAEEPAADSKAKPLPQWHGQWVLSEKINSALGFSDAKSREGGRLDAPPLSFQISLTDKIGDGIDARNLQSYRDLVFKRMGHRIVATGKWEMTFKDNPGIKSTDCFVTEHEGATYLWVPADYVVVFGGKASFLEGADKNHDAIVIDFNTGADHLKGVGRSSDTFAYQRKAK